MERLTTVAVLRQRKRSLTSVAALRVSDMTCAGDRETCLVPLDDGVGHCLLETPYALIGHLRSTKGQTFKAGQLFQLINVRIVDVAVRETNPTKIVHPFQVP